jgi:hypothetical protein
MSKLCSQEMRRRWKNPAYRKKVADRISDTLRHQRYRPTIRAGTAPEQQFPSQVSNLLDALGDEALEVVNVEPIRIPKHRIYCYSVTLIDGCSVALAERYAAFVQASGLDLYRLFRKPLPSGDGLSIVLIVGIPKGVH